MTKHNTTKCTMTKYTWAKHNKAMTKPIMTKPTMVKPTTTKCATTLSTALQLKQDITTTFYHNLVNFSLLQVCKEFDKKIISSLCENSKKFIRSLYKVCR